jgi:hypothetical protein
MRTVLAAVLTALLISTLDVTSAHARNERIYAELKVEFAKGLQDRQNALQKMRAYGLPSDKTNLLVNHYMTVVNDSAVVDRLFEEVKSLGVIDRLLENPRGVKTEIPKLTSFGYELFETLALRGLRRLEHDDLRQYLRALNVLLEVLPPKLCRALVLGDVSGQQAESATMVYAFSRMTNSEIESFLRVTRRAILAEVRDFPSVRSLSDIQRKNAQQAFETVFFKRLDRHPRSNQLIAAFGNMENAPDKDLCDANNEVIRTMLDMTGSLGEWQVRSFIESLQ